MTDAERYQLTHELWMLWQMRYRLGGPLIRPGVGTYTDSVRRVMEREVEIAHKLGYRHMAEADVALNELHKDWPP